jgi:charged multivesicular body protein 2A
MVSDCFALLPTGHPELSLIQFQSIFGKKKTLKEQLRENKRAINKSIRELDRERTSLQNSEKKLITDIKKAAKDGQMVAVHFRVRFALALSH